MCVYVITLIIDIPILQIIIGGGVGFIFYISGTLLFNVQERVYVGRIFKQNSGKRELFK